MNTETPPSPSSGPDHDPFAQAYPEHLAFWQAAEQGKLVLPTCPSCGEPHWYPRVICPLCGSTEIEWREASGEGMLHAFSVMRRVDEPYVVAYVRLLEGPILLTNIHVDSASNLHIDQPVRVSFMRTSEGRCVPIFSPIQQ
ncbi:Zn-ribbon domain-containing OB-fold protein [Variovorax boronicumulans]|uniref:Zn-ribbon domain-containing OB-fold protein n=1 Tax=Variovorax boronicumulans TaxID=436515 RepID=UPI0027D82428|nr:OB-fold domain-containing protein [Variovorax boronicumulans]